MSKFRNLSVPIPSVEGVVPPLQRFLGQVDSRSAMLRLSGSRGDWCVRTDEDGVAYALWSVTPLGAWSWEVVDAPAGGGSVAPDCPNILAPVFGVSLGTAVSQTVAIKAALDANSGKAFYFPPGDYRLDTTLTVSANNSLLLAPGARIYAGAAMSTLIDYDNGQTATDSLAADKFISGYGVLDGALLADKVLRVASVLRFSLEGLTFFDGVHRGLLVDAYAAEVSGHNLRFANTTTGNVSDNVAIEANGNDCRFSQIGMRDWTIGVWDKGANVWIDVHPWIGATAQLTARYQNSVAFKIAGDSLFIAPYADTYRSSFQSAQISPAYAVARIVAPKVFCASGNLTNALAALYPGVVFDLSPDAGGSFVVTGGKFAGHPTTNHAFASGTTARLTVTNSLPASYIAGFTGLDYNKRITRRVVAVTQSATPTINTDNCDVAAVTALAQPVTSMTTNLAGTPVAGDLLTVEVTDNGTARAIAWGAKFEAGTIPLPTTTVASTKLTVVFGWNTATSAWRLLQTSNYDTLTVTETNKTLTDAKLNRIVTTSNSWLCDLIHGGSVNLLQMSNAATGVAPSIGVNSISGDATVDLNLTTKGGKVTVDGTAKIVGVKVAVPATASSAGVVGQWAADASFHYACIAANTWVRSAAATW